MINLRPYQSRLIDDIRQAWASGQRNVLGVMPTGAGKTVTFSALNSDGATSCTIVHRQELVGQISKTYAVTGIKHNIIAPQPVINFCIAQHVKAVGRSFYDPRASVHVSGVDTLIRRHEPGDRWSRGIQRWTTDEAHHVRADNKWGKAVDLFPHAFGLGVTATPIRADNKSLHHEQGGVFHTLVQGPDMRWLIDQGNLCDYRVIAAKSSIDEAMLKVGSTGDFTAASTKKARKTELVGDVVETYLERVAGKQAIVFAVDVQDAHDIAGRFNDRGVRAAALDATSSDTDRAKQVEDFAAGRIQVLTNVDLFGEGFDVPACEVVIMARPTMSFGLFVQQFGRALRTIEGKQFGIIIDHVGNVTRMAAIHGMPDTPRRWELWRDENQRGTQRNPDAIPMRTCAGCGLAYPALQMICPFCGTVHEPAGRGAPQQVDGILAEMSPELLAQLRAARAQVETDRPMIPTGADAIVARAIENRHRDRQAAHRSLAEVMQVWGGIRQVEGDSDDQMQARFYHRFGVDVYTAQTLKTADAIKLRDAIRETLT